MMTTNETTPLDMWLYFEVTHALHRFCNPVNADAVDELGRVLDLQEGTSVLDIACGHAEFLIRWAEQHGIGGLGVDLSPYFVARAERNIADRVPDADLALVLEDGAKFETEERFDVAMSIGASWIWNGYHGTLDALTAYARPGGLVVVGEPFWRVDPPDAYMEADKNIERDSFLTLAGCHAEARSRGMELVWMRESTLEDWDRYESLQAAGADRFAQMYPDHTNLAEIRERRRESDEIYMRWGRDVCGFAIWAFRTPF